MLGRECALQVPPDEWQRVPLRSTAEQAGFTDGDWVESPHITDQGIRLVQTGNIGIGEFVEKPDSQKYITSRSFKELSCKWVYPGDILISRLADPIGRACRIPGRIGPCVTAVDCTIYRPDPELADSAFVLHHLNWRQHLNCLEALSGGSTRRRISRSNLGEVDLVLPPLPEQRRIAEILDAADEAIRRSERLIAKLREMKKGLLHDLLTRGLDAEGNLRDPEAHPEQFKDSPLGRIPREWELRELATTAAPGGFVDGDWIESQWITDQGIRLIQTGNIGISKFVERPEFRKFITLDSFKQLGCRWVYPDDLLISRLAEPAGRACRVPARLGKSVTAVDCTIFRPDEEILLRPFALHLLNSRQHLERVAALASGSTRQRVSRSNLGKLRVQVLTLAEQRDIATVLDAHGRRIRAEEAAVDKLRQVKRGLMDDLLTGRVRV